MTDLVTNRAEKSAIVKRFQSYGNDSMAYSRDHFEKNKHEECCELRGGRLNFYETAKPDYNTTAAVVEVERRRGTNILILKCGPGGRTLTFMEFDSKRLTDEWQETLCRCTGQPYDPNPGLRRVRSEMTAVTQRWRKARTRSALPDSGVEQVRSEITAAAKKLKRRELLTRSAFADSDFFVKQVDSEQVEVSLETPHKAPLEAPQEARVLSLTSEKTETDSRPDSLRSLDAYISPKLADLAKGSVKNEFNLSDLQQLKVKDYGGDVIVREAIPLCQLHVGDAILLRNDRGLEMNDRELIEHIRTSKVLTLARGAVGIVREEEYELTINFKGSQTVKLDTVDLILRACTSCCSLHYAEMPERSNLAITEINNVPVVIGSQPDQIAESMTEALETSGGELTLHLVPQSLLDAMAEEDDGTHEEQAHGIVEEQAHDMIVLTLARGVVCTAREEENEVVINIKGSQTVKLDTVDLILRACTSCCSLHYAEMPERSNLAITEINNIPVVIGSQPNQIAESMTEALETSGGKLTLDLVPQSLLDAMAEEDDGTHEEQAHGIVEEQVHDMVKD